VPHHVVGDWLRLTLAYNEGGAMGLSLGPFSRLAFTLLAFGALAVLYRLYRHTPPTAMLRASALALLIAGAVGNLVDRIRSPHGVIDFIDVGVGPLRFWTFNLADTWITLGAVLLATVLWRARRPEGAA
jgi:signal peptidase II